MNKSIVEKIKEKKKKIITCISVLSVSVIIIGVGSGIFLYNKFKSNINYTEMQAKEIALEQVPGEIVDVRKNLELERLTLEYKIIIKDNHNVVRQVTVDSKMGAITDLDNGYDD